MIRMMTDGGECMALRQGNRRGSICCGVRRHGNATPCLGRRLLFWDGEKELAAVMNKARRIW